jgi:hypothetical protein
MGLFDAFRVDVDSLDGEDTIGKLFRGGEAGADKALDFAFLSDGYGHETRLFGLGDGKETELDWWNGGAGLDPGEL